MANFMTINRKIFHLEELLTTLQVIPLPEMFILILVEYFLNFQLGELPVPHQEFINDNAGVIIIRVHIAPSDHNPTGSRLV